MLFADFYGSFADQCLCWQSSRAGAPPGTVWVEWKDLPESSGLARSRRTERLLWTHNDSGDGPRLFAFDADGRMHAIVELKGVEPIDWEDMCSFTWNDQPYLAVADVGDNGFNRKHVTIYGIKEPEIELIPVGAEGKDAKLNKIKVEVDFEVKVKYPDGPVNCEAMAYDPWRQQFILASKEQLQSQLFAVPFDPTDHKQDHKAKRIGKFLVPVVTGASISDDGRLLALGTYGPTCLLRRQSETPSADAVWISKTNDELELITAPMRRQGESICFDRSGTKLLMTSEGQPMPLFVTEVSDTAR